jgi:hypothetical protein
MCIQASHEVTVARGDLAAIGLQIRLAALKDGLRGKPLCCGDTNHQDDPKGCNDTSEVFWHIELQFHQYS